MFGIMILVSVVFLFVWVYFFWCFDKKIFWVVFMVVSIVLLLVVLFFSFGEMLVIFVFCVIMGVVFGCDIVMLMLILVDIVYVLDWSGKGRLGVIFYVMKNVFFKIIFVILVGIVFLFFDLVGFSSIGLNGLF